MSSLPAPLSSSTSSRNLPTSLLHYRCRPSSYFPPCAIAAPVALSFALSPPCCSHFVPLPTLFLLCCPSSSPSPSLLLRNPHFPSVLPLPPFPAAAIASSSCYSATITSSPLYCNHHPLPSPQLSTNTQTTTIQSQNPRSIPLSNWWRHDSYHQCVISNTLLI